MGDLGHYRSWLIANKVPQWQLNIGENGSLLEPTLNLPVLINIVARFLEYSS